MPSNPTVLIIPGFWEGPAVFNSVSTLLTASNFKTEIATLPSTGTTSPGNPSLQDDVAAVRTHLEKLVQQGDDVLLVVHSAGGFIGTDAMQGLDKKARQAEGLGGGVVGIVFVTAAVVEEGYVHQALPFAVEKDGALHWKNGWGCLTPQPAHGWRGTTMYAGWRDVESVYLVCEEDQCIPGSLQEEFARLAGSRIEKCSAGHMPQLSQPRRVVEVIIHAAAAFA
ncbi:Alpha/beta hydrolase fold-1 [Aspergillus bertholletiae]|uniref:Alpha/beta hydrolase fold-1 n=1 Tax=Aspergillus bertholletiae TaxID=1226010 RepID=A0A5N7ASV6_9EURO|nr:Alpha/beta hydrolase fold-1 [Aspergillus bertholletiae]